VPMQESADPTGHFHWKGGDRRNVLVRESWIPCTLRRSWGFALRRNEPKPGCSPESRTSISPNFRRVENPCHANTATAMRSN